MKMKYLDYYGQVRYLYYWRIINCFFIMNNGTNIVRGVFIIQIVNNFPDSMNVILFHLKLSSV